MKRQSTKVIVKRQIFTHKEFISNLICKYQFQTGLISETTSLTLLTLAISDKDTLLIKFCTASIIKLRINLVITALQDTDGINWGYTKLFCNFKVSNLDKSFTQKTRKTDNGKVFFQFTIPYICQSSKNSKHF